MDDGFMDRGTGLWMDGWVDSVALAAKTFPVFTQQAPRFFT